MHNNYNCLLNQNCMRSIQWTWKKITSLEKTKSYRCYQSSNIKHSVYNFICNSDTNCAPVLFIYVSKAQKYKVIKTETTFIIYDLNFNIHFDNWDINKHLILKGKKKRFKLKKMEKVLKGYTVHVTTCGLFRIK